MEGPHESASGVNLWKRAASEAAGGVSQVLAWASAFLAGVTNIWPARPRQEEGRGPGPLENMLLEKKVRREPSPRAFLQLWAEDSSLWY